MIYIIFVLNKQEETGANIIRMIYIIFVLNQQEATGGNVIRMIYIKCNVLRVRRAECCGNVGERMNIHIVLTAKLEGMNSLGVSRHI